MTEENSAGTIDINTVYSTSCPNDILHLPNYLFYEFIICLFGGYKQRSQIMREGVSTEVGSV